jgi:hypothetical protein
MELKVKRLKNNGKATLGELYINGVFECYTLEDEPREIKVMGETRIPKGRYQIKLREEGRVYTSYRQKYRWHTKGVPHLQNVPGFTYILIHIGNTEVDTAGCLLVGTKYSDYKLLNSTVAYKGLYDKIASVIDKEEVWITYEDLDTITNNS